jgi:hypothetical protein
MDKKNFAFGKVNFILLAVALVIIILGFILMSGGQSTATAFNPDTFSALHINVAPVVTFIGFVAVIVAIVYRPKE